ncbi:MAG: hypothetical protein OFPII_34070 [Osedax symbiont Rs1]|nr:MAG: hypothetical protein OFPII_34070 [Osedax symbiont Rs1]
MTSRHHIAQALDATGAVKTLQFHCKTNISHSVFTLKSRIQVRLN